MAPWCYLRRRQFAGTFEHRDLHRLRSIEPRIVDADSDRSFVGPSSPARARRYSDNAVHLGIELEVIPLLGVGFEVEEPVLIVEPSGHEDVEGVVDVVRR